jgi:hypothetical protein
MLKLKGQGMSKASEIGKKFGESIENFSTASKNTIESVLMTFANDSIAIMKKRIQQKARTKGASTLAESMIAEPFDNADGIGVNVISNAKYWRYVNDGVKGVKNKGKAPNSKFSFKNLYTPPAMIKSFKDYIARTGKKTAMIGGKRKSLYKTNKQTKQKTAKLDLIEKAAKSMAVGTKIGGIAPMQFKEKADTTQRRNKLKRELAEAMGAAYKFNVIKNFKNI